MLAYFATIVEDNISPFAQRYKHFYGCNLRHGVQWLACIRNTLSGVPCQVIFVYSRKLKAQKCSQHKPLGSMLQSFLSVFLNVRNKLVFVPRKPFLPSLIVGE
jgi:hypothetical protein